MSFEIRTASNDIAPEIRECREIFKTDGIFSTFNSLSAIKIVLINFILSIIFFPVLAGAEKKTYDERPQTSQAADIDRLVNKAGNTGGVRVIVRMDVDFVPEGKLSSKKAADQRARISKTQDQIINSLAGHNAKKIKKFRYTPLIAMEADSKALLKLISNPVVLSVQEDIPVPPLLDESIPLISADTAWNSGYTGAGWTVAILDTGVDKTHEMFSGSKVVSEACFSSNYAPHSATTVCPDGQETQTGSGSGVNCGLERCYHGTHVAGIAAGKSATIKGVAKDANIISIQVFSRFDSSTYCGGAPSTPCVRTYTSDQISALEHVYSLRSTYNIASVNMSLGGGQNFSNCDGDLTKPGIDNLHSVNIATIIASGNDGYTDSLSAPACVSTAVSVGATTKSDLIDGYSNSASFLTLLAPGSDITSSFPGNLRASISGTSMATPHVAGAWAILKQKNPAGTVGYIRDALRNSGMPVLDSRNGITRSRINVNAALGIEQHQLTITKAGSGTGSTTPSIGTITWTGNTGMAFYIGDTQVTLTAAADEESVFEGWSGGGCAGTGPCTVTMNASRNLTAIFNAAENVISMSSIGEPESIPDNNNSGADTTLTVPDGICMVTDVNVAVGITHTWVGDLMVRLTHQNSGRSATLFNRSCNEARHYDIFAVFDDEAEIPVNCPPNGRYRPAESLSVFDWLNAAGTWILNVSDRELQDQGTIDNWGIILTCAPVLRLSNGIEFWHASLQEACDDASDGDEILIREMILDEALIFDKDIYVIIEGGYDSDFEPTAGYSTVKGSIEISRGTVEVENLILK